MRLAARRNLMAALARYEDASLTYEPVGATRGDLPDGYGHTRRRVRAGAGAEAFDRAAHALLTWEMHRRSGLAVATEGDVSPGVTVLLGLGIGVSLVIPCRVIYVVDEPGRRGFAYGTLPDHPEQGEEAFVVYTGRGRLGLVRNHGVQPTRRVARAVGRTCRSSDPIAGDDPLRACSGVSGRRLIENGTLQGGLGRSDDFGMAMASTSW